MKFSMRDEPPACPPGPSWSSINVESPSDDAYTAAAMPAGPAPTIAKSTSCVGQCLQMPASTGQLLQGGIHEDLPVAAFNDRRLSRRAQCREGRSPCVRFRVEPREGDKVLVEKLADRVRVAAASRADDAQSQRAHLRQQLSAAREGDDQLLAKTRHAIQQTSGAGCWERTAAASGPGRRPSRSPAGRSAVDVARRTGPARERRSRGRRRSDCGSRSGRIRQCTNRYPA